MAVTVYRSTDTSAPALDGTGGSLVNVLDKCLVTGYGSKTGAGWTKPYTGTNAASFRMGGGNQFYLDVNDNGPGTATTQEARVRGYEAMTAVGTGTNPFPTTAQSTPGIIVRKSVATGSTTRSWVVVADDRTFYLFLQSGDTAGQWFCFQFGDFYSYSTSTDGFRTMIMGRVTEASGTGANDFADSTGVLGAAATGHYAARTYAGTGTSITIGKMGDYQKAGGLSNLSGSINIPNSVDGRIWISPVFVGEVTVIVMRGKMRGFMHLLHPASAFNDQDTVTGAGAYTGHTFLLFKTTGHGAVYCVDITGPWDTN